MSLCMCAGPRAASTAINGVPCDITGFSAVQRFFRVLKNMSGLGFSAKRRGCVPITICYKWKKNE